MRELDLKRGFTLKSEIFASFVIAMVFIITIADYNHWKAIGLKIMEMCI